MGVPLWAALLAALTAQDNRLAQARVAFDSCVGAVAADRKEDARRLAAGAISLFRRIATDEPGNPEPLVGEARVLSECELPLASVFAKEGIANRSSQLLDSALGFDARHWGARFALALNHYHAPPFLGKTDEAIRQFEILLAQQGDDTWFPEQATPYVYLGDLYRRKHRDADADRVWRRGATLFPADERLARRLRAQANRNDREPR